MVSHPKNTPYKTRRCRGTRSTALICLTLALLSLSVLSTGWAATIHAEVDRSRVSINESFTLVYEADGTVDGDPDFTPITALFEILQERQGSTMQIINGQLSQRRQWTLTLMGKETGFFTIPPISFGKDKSPGLRIDIEKAKISSKGASSEPIFIEVSVNPEEAYIQSQVIYTVRLYRSVVLLSGKLSEPSVHDADVVIEKIGKDREFETTRDGKRYKVIESRYAIFPQESGRLRIDPITFAGQIATRSRSRFNPFPGGGPVKRLRSEALDLEVKPVPQDKVRGRWLPAQNLRIVEEWPERQDGAALSKVGDPVTWTLTLISEGLTAAQLPEISPRFPKGFKSYPDQPTLNNETTQDGLIGIRQEKIALIATQAGSFLLPAIEIPWWNTRTEQVETARLPQRRIEVAPADPGTQAGPSLPHLNEADKGGALTEEKPREGPPRTSDFWSLVSMVLALGWAVTAILWWGSRQKPSADPVPEPPNSTSPKIGQIKRQLKKACMQNEAQAAKEALLSWAQTLRPSQTPSLGELGKQVSQTLTEEINRLNGALYGQTLSPWQDGPGLWAAFEAEQSENKQKGGRKEEVLAPMTPQP
ncbi:MAG: BatD family protein [Nitrospiria bacterium]